MNTKHDWRGADWNTYEASTLAQNPTLKKLYDEQAPLYKVGAQIVGLRIKYRLTQKELADRIGTKQSEIARIESGTRNLSIKTMHKIALAFGGTVQINIRVPARV